MEGKNNTLFIILVMLAGMLLGFFVTNNHLGRKAVQLEGGSKFDEVMWHIDQD